MPMRITCTFGFPSRQWEPLRYNRFGFHRLRIPEKSTGLKTRHYDRQIKKSGAQAPQLQLQIRRLAGRGNRMLESRPPEPRRNAAPRHPIRREENEFRDTTFRQGGVDYRRRYGHRASDRAGVYARRRKRDGGGKTIGKVA